MAITDLQISEELMTDAPSIKYRGDEGPKSPQQMADALLREEYEKYVYDLLEQRPDATPMSFEEFRRMVIGEGMMSKGPVLPEDPTKPVNPFGPKPIGPVLPDRQMAAYGGIMGMDGRKQYGIGSFFQEKIIDPLKKNPLVTAALAAAGYDLFGRKNSTIKSILDSDTMQTILKGAKDKKGDRKGGLYDAITSNIVPIIGGSLAGLFTKNTQSNTPGIPDDQTALQLADLKKSANILDQKQGLVAGLNFLPDVAARQFTPEEMVEAYAQTAANGGRIGFSEGSKDYSQDANYKGWLKLYEVNPDAAAMNENHTEYLAFYNRDKNNKAEGGRIGFRYGKTYKDATEREKLKEILKNRDIIGLDNYSTEELISLIQGLRPDTGMNLRPTRAEGGIMDLGGLEKDYRNTGGFVEIGAKEKADDVPARLSVNEFVFTADAVRNAGGGDIDEGAKVMERVMKHLEDGGQLSRESQGMGGAREMFEVSERLSEVV